MWLELQPNANFLVTGPRSENGDVVSRLKEIATALARLSLVHRIQLIV